MITGLLMMILQVSVIRYEQEGFLRSIFCPFLHMLQTYIIHVRPADEHAETTFSGPSRLHSLLAALEGPVCQ